MTNHQTTPRRIQRSRAKGWKMPEGAVYVGRPSLFGNPFICDDPAVAVEAFRRFLSGGTQSFEMGPGKLQYAPNAHENALHHGWPEWARGALHELRGHDLACWCAVDKPCHADVLLELANG